MPETKKECLIHSVVNLRGETEISENKAEKRKLLQRKISRSVVAEKGRKFVPAVARDSIVSL